MRCIGMSKNMIKLLDHTLFEDTFNGLRDKLILELFYATGIRLSELITLKENQIDLRNQTIKVIGKEIKREWYLLLRVSFPY